MSETGKVNAGQGPSFGVLLRRYRKAAGLTQEQLAERAYLSPFTVSALERGANQRPRPDTVDLLVQALGLDMSERAALAAAQGRRPDPPDWGQAGATALADGSAAPLVGRAHEVALLERHLRRDGPPLLFLAGEPGIGKSRLLQEAARRAIGLGWCVLEGGCRRCGSQDPYAPLLDALQRHIQRQLPEHLRAELQGCAWLVRLLPELADGPIEPLPAWTLPSEHERRLMVAAVRRFLSNVAGPRGTVLVLDDLQRADPDALDLLAILAGSMDAPPLRIVGAYRDTDVQTGDHLFRMLGDVAQAGLARQHRLSPLAAEAAARLLEHLAPETCDSAVRDYVLRRAGGVPFFLVSWAHALRETSIDGTDAGGQGDVPWTIAQDVQQRVAALPHPVCELIGMAAVVGRVVPHVLLAQVAERPEQDVLEALELACRARLLDEEGAQSYRFAHDVIHEVVEESLSAARRTLLHRRIAEALLAGPGDPPVDEIAYHYLYAEDTAAAALWLERAGDRAVAALAHVTAGGYYQEAARCLDALQRGSEAGRVREKWGRALHARALYAEALAVLESVAESYTVADDWEGLGRITASIGEVLGDRGTPQEGIDRVQRLVQRLEERTGPPSRTLALLYVTLAWLLLGTGRYAAQLATAERAVALTGAAGDERTRAQAELWRAEALAELGRPDEALAAYEAAATLAEDTGDLHTLSYLLPMMATSYREVDAVEAQRLAQRALAVAERYGNPVYLAWALNMQGCFAVIGGDWGQAHASFERALALDRQVDGSFASTYVLLEVGRLYLWEGRWAEAVAHLEQSVAAATRTGNGNLNALRLAHRIWAEHDVLAGDPGAARNRLLPLLDRPGLVEPDVALLLPMLAWALLELDDVDGADSVAAQAVARTRQQRARDPLVEALRVQALVRMRQERWPEAESILAEGLALARHPPCYPYAEARLLHVSSQMEAQTGAPRVARERLEVALAIFRRLGARVNAERVELDLTALTAPRLPHMERQP